jgi:hypothetical protein
MPDQTDKKRVYWRVGMFFEKVVEIDEPLPELEVTRWATRHAGNMAGLNDMTITEVVVTAEVEPLNE